MKRLLIGVCAGIFVWSASSSAARAEAGPTGPFLCPVLEDAKEYERREKDYTFLIYATDGWLYRTERDLLMEFGVSDEEVGALKTFAAALKAKGAALVIAYPPTRGMVHAPVLASEIAQTKGFDPKKATAAYTAFVQKMNAAGLPFVGMADYPADAPAPFYLRDHHWNRFGAQAMAKAVAKVVETLPEYTALTKAPFETVKTGSMEYVGTFQEFAADVCGTKLPGEALDLVETRPVMAQGVGEKDLFGDAPQPRVVLIGTSNSTMPEPSHANFDGYLKEALSVDVLNASLSGAGFYAPMQSYLNSEHYKTAKPAVVVWEIPPYYNVIGDEDELRQLTASAFGTCEQSALATQTVTLAGTKPELFSDLEAKGIAGGQSYLTLDFDKPVKRAFGVRIKYAAEDKEDASEKVKFKRSKSYPYDGQFAVTLSDNGALRTIGLNIPEEMAGLKVTARLCRVPGR